MRCCHTGRSARCLCATLLNGTFGHVAFWCCACLGSFQSLLFGSLMRFSHGCGLAVCLVHCICCCFVCRCHGGFSTVFIMMSPFLLVMKIELIEPPDIYFIHLHVILVTYWWGGGQAILIKGLAPHNSRGLCSIAWRIKVADGVHNYVAVDWSLQSMGIDPQSQNSYIIWGYLSLQSVCPRDWYLGQFLPGMDVRKMICRQLAISLHCIYKGRLFFILFLWHWDWPWCTKLYACQ